MASPTRAIKTREHRRRGVRGPALTHVLKAENDNAQDHGATKSYKTGDKALNGITLEIPAGQVVG
ncbi:hypothetical protein ACFS3B_10205 [Brucella rhizosphaerae]|uniref:hypothetical protein n=1 Tax=Brucella rhizosphaerae TaxID=571254 RepID=UPI00363012CA